MHIRPGCFTSLYQVCEKPHAPEISVMGGDQNNSEVPHSNSALPRIIYSPVSLKTGASDFTCFSRLQKCPHTAFSAENRSETLSLLTFCLPISILPFSLPLPGSQDSRGRSPSLTRKDHCMLFLVGEYELLKPPSFISGVTNSASGKQSLSSPFVLC